MFVGGLGVAASGNIGTEASVFEPVHGSAPPLVGTGKANPIATFLATAMMLDHLGETEQANRLRNAVEGCIADGQVTPDLGGALTTSGITKAVIGKLVNG
jgi:isocitrate/isopropylmalate dehydrogenase